MDNRVKCPHCFGDGEILTAIHIVTGERIYMCDKCKDIWEDINLQENQSNSFDIYMLKNKRSQKEFESWEYLIK